MLVCVCVCVMWPSALCRAFALEGRGIWHALSVSAAQQVYGPVRARADFRIALESPPAAPSEDPGRATLEGAWKARSLAWQPFSCLLTLDPLLRLPGW